MLVFYLISALLAASAYRLAEGKTRRFIPLLFSVAFIFTLRTQDAGAILLTFLSTWLWSRLILKRPAFLPLGILVQVLILVSFKYLIPAPPGGLFWNISGIPLGLSFYSLLAISYMTEVYYRNIQQVKPAEMFVYLFFFVKLSQGPVELAPGQRAWGSKPDAEDLGYAFLRILSGLFKKVVIADRLAPYVDAVFDEPYGNYGSTLLIGAYLFTFQLYFDFSGYSDMAIGVARLFGYRLPENFNSPFSSASVSEFWRRWHMSLILWLKTYVYTPLHYRLRALGKGGFIIAVFCTFLVSGLWHGWGLTFLVWSLLHAMLVAMEAIIEFKEPTGKGYRLARVLFTFHLVCFANIFFRAENMEEAAFSLKSIFNPASFLPGDVLSRSVTVLTGGGEWEKLFNFTLTMLLLCAGLVMEKRMERTTGAAKIFFPALTLIALILLFGTFSRSAPFIYRMF